MKRMDIETAKHTCMLCVMEQTVAAPYTAALTLIFAARGDIHATMTPKEFFDWQTADVRGNCAQALAEYAKAFPDG